MPQPAPARFDAADRLSLRASLLAATGPTLAMVVLVAGYALSARVCASNVRWLIAACISFGMIGTAVAARELVLLRRASTDQIALRQLRPAAIGLQVFCLLVLLAFGIALATVVPCG